MKQIVLLKGNKSLLTQLALLVMMIVVGGGNVWAQKTLPYSYGFENNNLAGEGWTLNNSGTSSIASLSGTAYEGSYYFRFIYNSNPPQYLISPELNPSSSGTTVSFYQKGQGDSYTISYNVGYSTSDTDPSHFTWSDEVTYSTGTYKLQDFSFLVSGIKYIAFRFNTSASSWGYYMYLDNITISSYNPYKTPTGFSLNSFTTTSATFCWTAGNSETAWQFAYSTSSSFTPGTDGTTLDISDNPYTLSGLKEGTTYYAAIRANYGSGHYSEWTDKVSFTPSDIVEETVNDGSSNSQYLPINYYGVEPISGELYKSQFIIPKGSLDFAKGRQINKLVFYASGASISFGNAEFEVYLKETDNSSFSSDAFESWGTCVVNSSKLSVNSDKEMVIELNTPFNYSGNKNLMIGFKQTVKGTKPSYFTWTAVSATNAGYYYYGSSGSRHSYLPKVTITTVSANTAPVQMGANGYTTFASTYPLDLTTANLPSGLKAYKATVDLENSKVRFTEINQAVPANTGMLLEGTANTTYQIPVALSGSAPEGNEFLVNTTGGTFSAVSGYTYYAMKKAASAEDALAFGTFNPSTVAIPSNKAYLKVENAVAVKGLTFVFDDTATAISSLDKAQPALDKEVYDLSGRRMVNGSLKKGLYIIGGKKMLVK